jgi:hypothetical protein
MLVAFLSMTYGRHDDLEPYGGDAAGDELERVSNRSRAMALGLGIFGGVLGLHRFYAGRPHSGVWMILTLGGLGIWWLYDVVLLTAGEFRDGQGRRIRHWPVQAMPGEGGPDDRGFRRLSGQVERLERDVAELAERLDFAERMLAQHRQRDRLPHG